MKNKPINVALCDDDPVFRKLFNDFVRKKPQINLVFSSSGGGELIRKLSKGTEGVKVVVVDMHMPGLSGIETIRCIRDKKIDVKIIGMSVLLYPNYVKELRVERANGFCYKNITNIINAIHCVYQAESFFVDEEENRLLHIVDILEADWNKDTQKLSGNEIYTKTNCKRKDK